MLLPRFELDEPESIDAACAVLRRYGDDAAVYAGGTELLLAMKERVLRYARLVNLKRIPGLTSVSAEDGRVTIGPLVTHHALARDATIRQRLPVLATLASQIGNIRVRVAGTLGGNVCFAEPHADPPTLLGALDARFALTGPEGTRAVDASEFFAGAYETARRPEEILTGVSIPVPPTGAVVTYHRFAFLERPTIAVAVSLMPDAGGRLRRARVVVGAVGPRPTRVGTVEAALLGLGREEVLGRLPEIARRAAMDVPVLADLHGAEDYKRHLVGVYVSRALGDAARGG